MRKLLARFDNYCNKLYEKLSTKFVGKVLIKVMSEIILAVLVSVFLFWGTSIYESNKILKTENDKLSQIYVSVSNEYINSLFGEPYITVEEDDALISNFYILSAGILRTVSENNVVKAYFITSQNENRNIPVTSCNNKKYKIGKCNYSDIDFSNPDIKANLNGNGRYCFYSEVQGTGRYAMYNYYLFATIPYGFVDNESSQLCNEYSLSNSVSEKDIAALRKKATPNTFGVIADGYENKIDIIPFVSEWENIYYMLTK